MKYYYYRFIKRQRYLINHENCSHRAENCKFTRKLSSTKFNKNEWFLLRHRHGINAGISNQNWRGKCQKLPSVRTSRLIHHIHAANLAGKGASASVFWDFLWFLGECVQNDVCAIWLFDSGIYRRMMMRKNVAVFSSESMEREIVRLMEGNLHILLQSGSQTMRRLMLVIFFACN